MPGMNYATGILGTLALLFKHGKREDLLEYGQFTVSDIEMFSLFFIIGIVKNGF